MKYQSTYKVVWDATTGLTQIVNTANGNVVVATLTLTGVAFGAVPVVSADSSGGTELLLTGSDPSLPTLSLTMPASILNGTSLTLNGTINSANAGHPVTLTINGQAVQTVNSSGSGSWSLSGTVAATGVSVINVSATDSAGNSGGIPTIYVAETGGAAVNFVPGTSNLAYLEDTAGTADTATGSNSTIYLSDAVATVSGGGDIINLDALAGTAVAVTGTAGNADTVNAIGGRITVAAAQAAVFGSSNTILATGGSHVDIFQTYAKWDTVGGIGETIVAHHAHVALTGGGNFIRALGGSTISLAATKKANTVKGDAATVLMRGASALVNGNSDQIYLYGSNTLQVVGSGDTFFVEPKPGNDTITGFGATDTMHFAAGIFANYAALLGATRQSGSDTLITINPHDTITLKNVMATSLSSSQFAFG